MGRIQLADNNTDAIMKLVEGNPGAISAIMACMNIHDSVDKDSMLGVLSVPLSLDEYGIYGSRIWILYKDVCGQNPVKMITLFRAIQLGIYPFVKMKRIIDACENPGIGNIDEIPHAELLDKVRNELTNFAEGVKYE